MAFDGLIRAVGQLMHGEESTTGLSRRDMFSGIGLIGVLAVAGPTILASGSADAVELLDDNDEWGEHLEHVRHSRRRGRRARRRGRRPTRRRRLHARRRRRRRPSVHFHFSTPRHYYTPRYYYPYRPRRYYGGRCEYWHRMCTRNWGYANPNYVGCMRYHGCW